MQDMTSEACAEAPYNVHKTLIDNRDQNTYTITKIQNKTNTDAHCWMTQNLRLVGNRTLTQDNSDVTSNYTLPVSVTISDSDNPKKFTSSDQYQSLVYYAGDIGYGAYYNWYTATASTGDNTTTSSTNATSSICPRGWRLPTSGSNDEFYQLPNDFTQVNQLTTAPYNFVYSGETYNSGMSNIGTYGFYWSSTADSTSIINSLSLSSNSLNPSRLLNRCLGLSVRCVAH